MLVMLVALVVYSCCIEYVFHVIEKITGTMRSCEKVEGECVPEAFHPLQYAFLVLYFH